MTSCHCGISEQSGVVCTAGYSESWILCLYNGMDCFHLFQNAIDSAYVPPSRKKCEPLLKARGDRLIQSEAAFCLWHAKPSCEAPGHRKCILFPRERGSLLICVLGPHPHPKYTTFLVVFLKCMFICFHWRKQFHFGLSVPGSFSLAGCILRYAKLYM